MASCDATLTNRGFTAWVECDGRKLECYDVQNSSESSITCWIASEAGKAFSVNWREEVNTGISTVGKVFLDSKNVRASRLNGEAGCQATVSAILVSETEDRPFEFSTIPFDGCGGVDQHNTTEALGSIRVDIHRVVYGRAVPAIYTSPTIAALPSSQPDNKKAAVHHTLFGEARRRPLIKQQVSWTLYTPGDKLPYASFLFQYRPRDRLQFLNIIEDDSGPVQNDHQPNREPLEESSPSHSEEDDPEDLKNIQMLEAELAKVRSRLRSKKAKREPSEDNLPARKKIKKQKGVKGVKVERSDEVIDLTLD